jgi:preprotein translocase subunit SecF
MPYAIVVSALLVTVSLCGIFIWPKPNWGIDFAGGTEIQVAFKQPIEMGKLREAMESLRVGDVKVQEWLGTGKANTNFLIRLEKLAEEPAATATETQPGGTAAGATGKTTTMVEAKITEVFGKGSFEILKSDYVGPKVGKELRNQGALAVIIANLLILVYVSLRFEFRYAFGAVIALFHDAIISAGLIVFTQKSFDLTIIAALLSIVGYSINDTIVVFDRIRENLSRHRRMTLFETVNAATNETLSRTLLTSFVTWLAVFCLWLLGGSSINGFAFCMMMGIIVGTYSSVFVASAYVVYTERLRDRRRTAAAATAGK